MNTRERILWVFLVTGVLAILHDVLAQERDTTYPATRSWELPVAAYYRTIGVVDTAGVCLYIWGDQIAAVPKTQLAPGRGCQ